MEHFQIHSDSVSIGKMRYFASNKFSYGQRMIMASERFGNIEDLSYKDDISLFRR